jgi:predicted nucleic acid-binding protein
MVLVDTSVWVSHLQSGNARLGELLDQGKVIAHPFVIGELACRKLKNRHEILSLLKALPAATCAEDEEVFQFIEDQRLMGLGLGFVDVHLLAAARLTAVPLWTNDKRLKSAAIRLHVNFEIT